MYMYLVYKFSLEIIFVRGAVTFKKSETIFRKVYLFLHVYVNSLKNYIHVPPFLTLTSTTTVHVHVTKFQPMLQTDLKINLFQSLDSAL